MNFKSPLIRITFSLLMLYSTMLHGLYSRESPDCPIPEPITLSHGDQTILLSAYSIRNAYQTIAGHKTALQVMDPHFLVIKKEWIPEIIDWLKCIAHNLEIDLSDKEIHRFDNDNIARLIASVSEAKYSRSSNLKASLPIGYIKMYRRLPWGDHPADNQLHEYVLIYTEAGFFVLDPGSERVELLKNHPNRSYIKRAIFG